MALDRPRDFFGARDTFTTSAGKFGIYRLSKLEEAGLCKTAELPYSIRILLEAVLRNCDGYQVTEEDVRGLAGWKPGKTVEVEVPFKPARVVLQDFTGVPCVVDLAHMRSAMSRLGGDPKKINPLIPVDLVIDHSVQVDRFAIDAARWNSTSTWNSNATANATSSSAGGKRRSTISASCRRMSASCIR